MVRAWLSRPPSHALTTRIFVLSLRSSTRSDLYKFIAGAWDRGYRISSLGSGAGGWFACALECLKGEQSYKYTPFKDFTDRMKPWILEQSGKGMVPHLWATDATGDLVIMTKPSDPSMLLAAKGWVYITGWNWKDTKEWIANKWKEKKRITTISISPQGQYSVVMMDSGRWQSYIWSEPDEFPTKWVKEKWAEDKNAAITSIVYDPTDQRMLVVMTGHSENVRNQWGHNMVCCNLNWTVHKKITFSFRWDDKPFVNHLQKKLVEKGAVSKAINDSEEFWKIEWVRRVWEADFIIVVRSVDYENGPWSIPEFKLVQELGNKKWLEVCWWDDKYKDFWNFCAGKCDVAATNAFNLVVNKGQANVLSRDDRERDGLNFWDVRTGTLSEEQEANYKSLRAKWDEYAYLQNTKGVSWAS
jgi:hypothetical protein